MTTETPMRQLLTAARRLLPCDAAALLRLEGRVLLPVAVEGLSEEALGRRFPLGAHPRLDQLLASAEGLRFPADCGLPDPYDGLVDDQAEILPVHDCMGLPLRHQGRLWGLLTMDALNPEAFAQVTPAQQQALVGLLESGIAADIALREMAATQQAREQALTRALRAEPRPR
jgi:anaerobic nitric oxide reductase transcription regulator